MGRKYRAGDEAFGLKLFSDVQNISGLSSPETWIWNSIRQLRSMEFTSELLRSRGIAPKSKRTAASSAVRLYIDQAHEFYQIGAQASDRSSPLLFYYSFLNLAKAVVELDNPDFRSRSASRSHGMSYRATSALGGLSLEKFSVSARKGVWHELAEVVCGATFTLAADHQVNVVDAFSLCPEVSAEFERSIGRNSNVLPLSGGSILLKKATRRSWLEFQFNKGTMAYLGVTTTQLASWLSQSGIDFDYFGTRENDHVFQQRRTRVFGGNHLALDRSCADLRRIGLIPYQEGTDQAFYLSRVSLGLPHWTTYLLNLYMLFFWFGSVVRYDPAKVSHLEDSREWLLLSGFLMESRQILLEQFEWHLFRKTTLLRHPR